VCYNREGGTQCYITHVASDPVSIFQQFMGINVVNFHIHMLLTCHIYLNHDSDCGRFACQFVVRSFFGGGCRFTLLYNIGWVG